MRRLLSVLLTSIFAIAAPLGARAQTDRPVRYALGPSITAEFPVQPEPAAQNFRLLGMSFAPKNDVLPYYYGFGGIYSIVLVVTLPEKSTIAMPDACREVLSQLETALLTDNKTRIFSPIETDGTEFVGRATMRDTTKTTALIFEVRGWRRFRDSVFILAIRSEADPAADRLSKQVFASVSGFGRGVPGGEPDPEPTGRLAGLPGGELGGVPGGVPSMPESWIPPLQPAPPEPPEMPEPPRPEPPKFTRVSGGVLAGKAVKRVQPEYPKMAKDAKIEGSVVVEVTIDERGNVIKARAVSGHPLLRDAAVSAARQWTFSKTLLAGVPVKVIGTLAFTFSAVK